MSNWDLMMPGMGLTAIGLAGVTISYSGIAHTFIDGMHALTGLTMFIGLIFLSAGILDGGVSTSNRAKATTLVVASIALSFGAFTFALGSFDSTNIFAGAMMIIASPAIVIAYISAKMPQYLRPVGTIFILAAGAGVVTFIAFGLVGPGPYLLPDDPAEEPAQPQAAPAGPVYTVAILAGSDEQGKPDYEPDAAVVPRGHVVEWVNEDDVAHTATSSVDSGETFHSGLMDPGATFAVDTGQLPAGLHEYLCIVHPWMVSTLTIEEAAVEKVSIPDGAGIQQEGQIYYEPETVTVPAGTAVLWDNVDTAVHTVTATDGGFDSDLIQAGASYERTFDDPGTFDYFCIVHPWMVGAVIAE